MIIMKKTAHGLEVDKRKSLIKNAKENGIERTLTKGSGKIRIKESKLRMAKRKNDTQAIEKLENELQELYKQVKGDA